jgi:anti-sigma regulatory factor (Ser/Thr protein kinase)
MAGKDPAPGASLGETAILADADAPDGSGPPVLDQAFDSGTLYALRAAVQAHAGQLGMPEAGTDDLVIAIHELAANAVRHGAGGGRLRMWKRAGKLHCQVEDAGLAGAPESPGAPGQPGAPGAPEPPGANAADSWPFSQGHGLWLVRLVSDQIAVFSGPEGTRATVVFALPGLCLRRGHVEDIGGGRGVRAGRDAVG